ncbi:FUSC family protein, partial [Actinacidiphila epipremni]
PADSATAPPTAATRSPAPDTAPPSAVLTRALDDLTAAAAAVRRVRAREVPTPEAPRAARSARKGPQPQTRLTAQLAAAMGAAFAAGHLLFPHHWTWTVITAFVVCSAARSRGDVVHRSGLRIGGAFAGAVTGTLAAHLVAGSPPLGVAVIFCYLFVGLWLRDVNYAVWAFCVTSLLAVMYSLNGEHDTAALLLQRPEGILLGSACGILAAYFVLPLRTETVMRGRAARALQVVQDLLAALREPTPDPAALRELARAADLAAGDLATAASSARAHRALIHRHRRTAAPHAADWADTLALCVREARALAALPPADLAAARAPLGLTARNVAQVRRRLGHRPDAQPPRPVAAPALLRPLNDALATLYDQLPAPPAPPQAPQGLHPDPAPAPTAAP